MTTYEQHMASNMFGYYREMSAADERIYLDACKRWQENCALDGLDPETEREYYEIDELARRHQASLAAAISWASR